LHPRPGYTPELNNLLITLTFTVFVMPYYPVNTNKQTERKLTLGQLITMATRLMKASIS